MEKKEQVNHPAHYNGHPSGVECIVVAEHMGFNLGNALKYIWRADLKGDALQDLEKARWYVDREIERRKKAMAGGAPEQTVRPEEWIQWGGGKCPVPPATIVYCKMRDWSRTTQAAETLKWEHIDGGSDIVAYRVVK